MNLRKIKYLTVFNKERISLILILLAITFLGGICRKIFFSPPDNLKLFLKKKGTTLFNPVYSPDGKKVYYLADSLSFPFYKMPGIGFLRGSLWVINTDGSGDRKVLHGEFKGIAISPDGSKLAMIDSISKVENGIVIVDTSGKIIDTIYPSQPVIEDVEFSHSGLKVYYYASGGGNQGFYRVNIDGSNEELVLPKYLPEGGYFDLFPNDSIFFVNLFPKKVPPVCQISPLEPNKVVTGFIRDASSNDDLILLDLSTGRDSLINAQPFYDFNFPTFPFWSPDGKKIIFTAAKTSYPEFGGNAHPYGELWILEYKKEGLCLKR